MEGFAKILFIEIHTPKLSSLITLTSGVPKKQTLSLVTQQKVV